MVCTLYHNCLSLSEFVKKYGKEAFLLMDNHITITLKFPYEININNINNKRNLAPYK